MLSGLSPLARTFSVSRQGPVTPAVRAQATGVLARANFGASTEVVLLNPVRLSGVVVRPAAIDPLARWISGGGLRRVGPCRPAECPVMVAGGAVMPSVLAAAGVRMQVVGRTDLASAAPLGFAPSQTADEPPVVLTGDVAG